MLAGLEGRECESCYGKGELPTDEGPIVCPDCGGAGAMPRPDTHAEWRMREIERALEHGNPVAETDHAVLEQAVRWLIFELRRARGALVDVLALSEELPESTPELARLRFILNRALALYDEVPAAAGPPK